MLSKNVFIYFIIFAFLFFVPFVICEGEEICEGATSNNRYECFKKSSSNKLCCYDNGQCHELDSLKKNTKNYDCGIVNNNVEEYEFSIYHPISSDENDIGFQTCGAKKPKKKKDCTDYSQLTNSCCYFYGNGIDGCNSIGKKYSGPNEEIKIKINDDLTVTYECNGNFLNTILNNFFGFFLFLYLLF